MKNLKTFILSLIAVMLFSFSSSTFAQDEEESSSIFDAGLDVYSSYIWRGSKFGTGPAFQPWMSAAIGGLEIGAWGSVNSGGIESVIGGEGVSSEALEMDLYISYSFDFGLGLGVTDYYFGQYESESISGTDTTMETKGWFGFDEAHYIEPMLSYSIGDLSLTAAYMFAPGFDDGDMYFEAGYSIGGLDIALGAGDGAYTSDGNFMICNISLGTSKEIKITDSFSLPVSGGVVLNPSTEGFFIYAGFSL